MTAVPSETRTQVIIGPWGGIVWNGSHLEGEREWMIKHSGYVYSVTGALSHTSSPGLLKLLWESHEVLFWGLFFFFFFQTNPHSFLSGRYHYSSAKNQRTKWFVKEPLFSLPPSLTQRPLWALGKALLSRNKCSLVLWRLFITQMTGDMPWRDSFFELITENSPWNAKVFQLLPESFLLDQILFKYIECLRTCVLMHLLFGQKLWVFSLKYILLRAITISAFN